MAFTVPNRPDTGIAADQAEPDKGDFQTLGYQKSGVLTGGAVTTSGSNTVDVGVVSGYLNGEYFNITSGSNKSITAPASGNAKFVLILVQKSGTTFNVTALQGTTSNNGESATNARFPDDVDYTNKMLLASVYYAINDTDISTTSIVDKRVFILPQANPTAVATAPSNTVGAIGEIRVDSSITPAETQSLVWIKTAATTWTNLAKYSTTEPADGTHGTSPTITVDSVITGAAGTQAAVENVGSSSSAVELKFTIPRGDTGANAVAPAYSYKVTAGGSNPQTTVNTDGLVSFLGGTNMAVVQSGSAFTFNYDGPSPTPYSFNVGHAFGSTTSPVNSGDALVIYGGDNISVTRSGALFTIDYDGPIPTPYNFNVTEGAFSPQATVSSGDVLLIYGGANISVTRSGTSFTIDYDGPSPTPYYFNVASAFGDTVTRVDSGDSLVIYGGSNISVTRSGGYFNIAYDGPVPTAYDFKVAEGVFSTPHTITSGDSLVLYGGDGISVTRSGAAFTFAATGSYLPLSAGSAYPLSGVLSTQSMFPLTSGVSYIGGAYTRYRKAYFTEAVDVSSDLRLKEDITESPGLGLVNRLKPLSYRLKAYPDKKHWGFGAQDVAKVCDPDTAVVDSSDEGPQGIAYTELMAPMVKAIQELSERLEAIENG